MYHLRSSQSIRTLVLLLGCYFYTIFYKKEMIVWQQLRSYLPDHGDV
nr:MAG TPA: hypothetical protein [Caudoviricetes sp.]